MRPPQLLERPTNCQGVYTYGASPRADGFKGRGRDALPTHAYSTAQYTCARVTARFVCPTFLRVGVNRCGPAAVVGRGC